MDDLQIFALKTLHEQPDPINVAFFSRKNLNYIQKRIVLDVDKLTGVEITRQDDRAVTIVMLGMYQRMRGATQDLTIHKLNNAVLQECVKQCVSAVQAQKAYVRDATTPLRLLERGVNPSIKGTNVLYEIR